LLKPVGAEQLIKEVNLLISKIEQEREKKIVENRNNKLIREHYHSLKRAFVNDLLSEKIKNREEINGHASALGLDISWGNWLAIVFSIDDYLLWSEMEAELDQESLRYLALNIIEEVLQRRSRAFGIMGELDQLTVFVECKSQDCSPQENCHSLDVYLKEIQEHTANYLNCTLTIGIGRPVDSILTIADSWKQALSAVRQKVYTGKEAIIHYQDNFDSYYSPIEYPSDLEREIVAQMRLCNRKEMHDALEKYCDALIDNKATVPEYRQHCQRLFFMSVSGLEESGVDSRDLPSELNNYASKINQLETVADFKDHLKRYLDQLLDLLQTSKDERYTCFVRSTMDYVREHYQDDLSLSDLAQIIHITPNYLSKIFKKETGVNFVDWLNQFRIEKAKELLIGQPGLKGYEISDSVGFRDYKYFTYVFKKYTGKTPRDFRG
jgi:two-component system response regulator YesN